MTPQAPPRTISFVCTANICRSAYADVRARQMHANEDALTFRSAGIYGMTGSPIDTDMGHEATERGADITWFRAHQVTAEFIRSSDLVLTAEAAHRTFILEEWPQAFRTTFTFAQFRTAIARVDPLLSGADLLAALAKHRPTASPEGDVPDPYGRGPAAAAACARILDEHLQAILPRLVDHP